MIREYCNLVVVDTEAEIPPVAAVSGHRQFVIALDTGRRVHAQGGAWVDVVGTTGIQGEQGIQGPPGEPGADGQPGTNGTNGTNGADGLPGTPGAPGAGFAASVKLTADLSPVTATALADATGLSFALTANRYYSFEFLIRFRSAATTTGAQFAINAPANSHLVYQVATALTAAAAGAPTFRTARAVNIGTASASADAANADLLATIKGIVLPTTNGTLIVRQATEVAASGVTVKAGSCGFLMDYGT